MAPSGETYVAKAAAVLVVTITPAAGDAAWDTPASLDVVEAVIRGGGGAAVRAGPDTTVAGFPDVATGVSVALAVRDRLSDAVCVGLHAGEAVLSAEGSALAALIDVAWRFAAAAGPGTIVVSGAARFALPAGTDIREVDAGGSQGFLIVSAAAGPAWPRRTVLTGLASAAAVAMILAITMRRQAAAPGDHQLTLGVLRFKASAGMPDDAWIHVAVRDGLNTQLSQIAGVTVYSSEFLDFLMSREKVSEMELATRLGIDKMLTGSVTVMGGTIRVDTQIVEVASGKIESAFTHVGRRADFLTLEADVISGVIERFDMRLTAEEKERLSARRASHVEALRRLLEVEGERQDASPSAPSDDGPLPAPSSWLEPEMAWADDEAIARAAILAVLERYRKATEAGDVAALVALHAELPAEQRAGLERYFQNARNLRVTIERVEIAIVGEEAVVSFSRTDDFTDVPTGRPMYVTMRVTRTLKHIGGEWKLAPK